MSKDGKNTPRMLLDVSSWKHEKTRKFLERLQKSYNVDSMRGAQPGAHLTIQQLATPGRIRRLHEGVVPGNAPVDCWAGLDELAKEQDWTAWQHGHRRPRLVRGRAGMGKTFFSRWAAGKEIHASIKALENFEVDCDEIHFPIWLSAAKLVELPGSNLAECLRAWVLAQGSERGQGHQDLAERLYWDVCHGDISNEDVPNEEVSNGGKNWSVFIDSLDQLEHLQAVKFHDILKSGGEFNRALVLTSRPDVRFSNLFPDDFPDYDVLELLPFNELEQVRYLRCYGNALASSLRGTRAENNFGNPGLSKLESSLYSDDRLRDVASTPLLLRFLCDLAVGGGNFAGHSRNSVYGSIIDSLLRGKWDQPSLEKAPARSRGGTAWGLRERTRLICAMLFFRRPESGDFSMPEWSEAWEEAKKIPGGLLDGVNPDAFCTKWIELGLVESDSDDAADSRFAANPRYVFRHRSLLEFFAAEYLAGLKVDGWKEKVRPHLGFRDGEFHACRPGWAQTLEFLAGHPPDRKATGEHAGVKQDSPAQELIELVEEIVHRPGDDLALPLLELQVRWAATAGDAVSKMTRRRLARKVIDSGFGASVSDPKKIIPPLHALTRAFYQDLARDEVMKKTAIAALAKKKFTYGLGLLGPDGARAIREILESSFRKRWPLPPKSRQETSGIPARDLGYLIDLARTGEDKMVAGWAEEFRVKSVRSSSGNKSAASATAQALVPPLLTCGGEESFEALKAHLKQSEWNSEAFQAGLEGPQAHTLSRCIFEGIGPDEMLDGLVGINFLGYDEELEKIFKGAGSPPNEPESPVTRQKRRQAGRVLLLRRSSQSHSIIGNILHGDPATIELLAGGNLSEDDPELIKLLVIAIRAAADARLAHLRGAMKTIADQTKAFQVRYAATLFLCELGRRDDLAELSRWLRDEETRDMGADEKQPALRLALKLKAVQAHLSVPKLKAVEGQPWVCAPEAKNFVSNALVEIVRSREGWRPFRLKETPSGVQLGDFGKPGPGARNASARALWLVAHGDRSLAKTILRDTVAPMVYFWRDMHLLVGRSRPRFGTQPHVPLEWSIYRDALHQLRLAHAISDGKYDDPRLWQRGQQWPTAEGVLVNFDDMRQRRMTAGGGIPFQPTQETELLLWVAEQLVRRVTFKLFRARRTPVGRIAIPILSILVLTIVVTLLWAISASGWNYLVNGLPWEASWKTAWTMLPRALTWALVLLVQRRCWQSIIRWNPEFRQRNRVISSTYYLSIRDQVSRCMFRGESSEICDSFDRRAAAATRRLAPHGPQSPRASARPRGALERPRLHA